MNLNQKYLVLVIGVPASGKSYFTHQLSNKFSASSIDNKIFSTDNLQAFLTHRSDFNLQTMKKFFFSQHWNVQLQNFKLNKQMFDEKSWNMSRSLVENFDILDLIFIKCQMLIIDDQLPLKSQRKPFRKYCSEKNIKFLEIRLEVTLEEAIQNNDKRGHQKEWQKVSNQVIVKSFKKFESNPDAIILKKNTISEFLEQLNLLANFKKLQIQDNYRVQMAKKNIKHEYGQKELDENELRKLITDMIKDQAMGSEYFGKGMLSKVKAQMLAECKKIYIQQKRKIAFKQIIENFMQKYKNEKLLMAKNN